MLYSSARTYALGPASRRGLCLLYHTCGRWIVHCYKDYRLAELECSTDLEVHSARWPLRHIAAIDAGIQQVWTGLQQVHEPRARDSRLRWPHRGGCAWGPCARGSDTQEAVNKGAAVHIVYHRALHRMQQACCKACKTQQVQTWAHEPKSRSKGSARGAGLPGPDWQSAPAAPQSPAGLLPARAAPPGLSAAPSPL